MPSTETEICGDSGKGPSQLERGEKVIALERARELSGENFVCVGRPVRVRIGEVTKQQGGVSSRRVRSI